MILRHDRNRFLQALLRHSRNILTVNQNSAALHVVISLQQRKKRRFAAARWADQTGAPARLKVETQVFKDTLAIRKAKRNIFECNGCAMFDERHGFRMISQLMRDEKSRERL